MKTASMMILPYLLLAFTGLPVFASASDGDDPAASLPKRPQRGEDNVIRSQREEDIVIGGDNNRGIRRKLAKGTKCPSKLRSRDGACQQDCDEICGVSTTAPTGPPTDFPSEFPTMIFDLQICESYSRRW